MTPKKDWTFVSLGKDERVTIGEAGVSATTTFYSGLTTTTKIALWTAGALAVAGTVAGIAVAAVQASSGGSSDSSASPTPFSPPQLPRPSTPPSPSLPPPSPPASPPAAPAADSCGTGAEQGVYDANNLCDDWSTIVVQSEDDAHYNGAYWWSYESGELTFFYDENHTTWPDPGFDGLLPDPNATADQARLASPDFNNNSICEDGMGASRVENVGTAPHGGYWIQLYVTDNSGVCQRSITIDGVRYTAIETTNAAGYPTCHIYYAPCPAGGDCADCGRGTSFGNGDGVTRPTGDPVSATPASVTEATEGAFDVSQLNYTDTPYPAAASEPYVAAGTFSPALVTTDLVQTASHGAALEGGPMLPPIRTAKQLRDLLDFVKQANSTGSLIGMNMPRVFITLFEAKQIAGPNGTVSTLRVRV